MRMTETSWESDLCASSWWVTVTAGDLHHLRGGGAAPCTLAHHRRAANNPTHCPRLQSPLRSSFPRSCALFFQAAELLHLGQLYSTGYLPEYHHVNAPNVTAVSPRYHWDNTPSCSERDGFNADCCMRRCLSERGSNFWNSLCLKPLESQLKNLSWMLFFGGFLHFGVSRSPLGVCFSNPAHDVVSEVLVRSWGHLLLWIGVRRIKACAIMLRRRFFSVNVEWKAY